ncbi:MAG TPA: hypothetical protein PK765_06005 [bacterium]|nr:hypothetical protein [bacterium]
MAPLDLILSQNPHGFEDHLLDLLLLLLNASPEMEKELQKIVRYADNDGNSA